MIDNPLLDFSRLPRYASIRPEHVAPAIDELLARNRGLIATLCGEGANVSWDTFAEPLEGTNERLGRAWGTVVHLHAVDDNAAIRDAYNTNLPKITRYYTELAQNLELYGKFKALRASREFTHLSPARRRIVENSLRDYRLGGAELVPEKKARFAEIQEDLAALEAKFSENLLDATNAFSELITDRGALLGIPDDVVQAAEEAARKDGLGGWKLTLQAPSYGPVMQYAERRELREKLYRAHVTRASEFGKPELNNTLSSRESFDCGRKRRACWDTRASLSCPWFRRWPTHPRRRLPFSRTSPPGPCRTRARITPSSRASPAQTSGLENCGHGTWHSRRKNCAQSSTRFPIRK